MPLPRPDDSPAWQDPVLARWAPQRRRLATLFAGTDAVRAAGPALIPQMPRERQDSYRIRLTMTDATPFYATAVKAATGLLLKQPPRLVPGVPPVLDPLWADIDGLGTAVPTWLQEVTRLMLQDGYCLVVAASPVTAAASLTRADEQRFALRPYAVVYKAEQVRSLRTDRIGGRLVLTQLVLEESVEVPSGQYATETETRFRVLRYGAPGAHTYTVLRQVADGSGAATWQLLEEGTIQTELLPVVEFTVDPRAGMGRAQPPLLDVGDLNLAHVNVLSDRRWSLKMACYPLPIRKGYIAPLDGGETTAGPTEVMDLPADGDFKWVAPPAEAMVPTRDELQDIERRIAALTMAFVAGNDTKAETATARVIDQQAQDATLSAVGLNLRDGLDRLFGVFAELLGVVAPDRCVEMPLSFRGMLRDPAYLRVLLDTWQAGGLPLDALLQALQSGALPDDFDVEAAAVEALVAAQADQQAAADRAAGMQAPPAPQPPTAPTVGAAA